MAGSEAGSTLLGVAGYDDYPVKMIFRARFENQRRFDDGDGMGLAGFDEGVVEGDQRWVPLAGGGLGSGEQARSGALVAEASQPADPASWSRRPRQEPVLR